METVTRQNVTKGSIVETQERDYSKSIQGELETVRYRVARVNAKTISVVRLWADGSEGWGCKLTAAAFERFQVVS